MTRQTPLFGAELVICVSKELVNDQKIQDTLTLKEKVNLTVNIVRTYHFGYLT
jgi:hypothetical protein